MNHALPWLFPVPVRRSRFRAGNPDHARFNIEVAHDRMAPFAFAPSPDPDVLHYDLQTQITGNARGRLGSGRGGAFAGHCLKGVGRTPAAANWNEPSDLYHASGHLSVGSALRERTITRFLQARDLGHAIVPCVAVLLRSLTKAESNAIAAGRSSSRPDFAAADATHAALTAKPADFARLSNIAFALDHFANEPQALGTLFLEIDRLLRPPEARDKVDGEPRVVSLETMKPTDFFRALDLPDNPLKPGFRRPRASRSNHYAVFNAEEILTEATLSRFHALGLRLGTAALFHKKPGSMGIIHDDVALQNGRWRKNVAAINWNLSGADSLMRWSRIAAPGNVPDPVPPADAGPWYRTLNGIHYGFFGARDRENLPQEQVQIPSEAFIGSATLVRTNLPHAVENTDSARGRWALSVRFEPDFKSWAAANAVLKPLWATPHRTTR